ELVERVGAENLGHQPYVLVHPHLPAVADGDARALLPTVLQRIKAKVGEVGDVFASGIDAEQAAGFLHALLAKPGSTERTKQIGMRREMSRRRRRAHPSMRD